MSERRVRTDCVYVWVCMRTHIIKYCDGVRPTVILLGVCIKSPLPRFFLYLWIRSVYMFFKSPRCVKVFLPFFRVIIFQQSDKELYWTMRVWPCASARFRKSEWGERAKLSFSPVCTTWKRVIERRLIENYFPIKRLSGYMLLLLFILIVFHIRYSSKINV